MFFKAKASGLSAVRGCRDGKLRCVALGGLKGTSGGAVPDRDVAWGRGRDCHF